MDRLQHRKKGQSANIGLEKYRDLKSALETAVEEREIEIAKNFILLGLDNATIAKGTDLTVEQIEQLRSGTRPNR